MVQIWSLLIDILYFNTLNVLILGRDYFQGDTLPHLHAMGIQSRMQHLKRLYLVMKINYQCAKTSFFISLLKGYNWDL